MYYINAINPDGSYSIMNSDTGVAESFPYQTVLQLSKAVPIRGVRGNSVSVYNASGIVNTRVRAYDDIVRDKVFQFSEEQCYDLARSVHFVKQIKNLSDINKIREVTYEHIFPDDIRQVINEMPKYSNNITEIKDIKNTEQIKQALNNNICMVLQHKTNGALTAFYCTANINIMDTVYAPYFIDTWFLTQQLYQITAKIDSFRATEYEPKEKNPSMLNVYSCSLRFRPRKNGRDPRPEMSNPFYTVNTDKVLALFMLNNPQNLTTTIKERIKKGENLAFDEKVWQGALQCVRDEVNYFKEQRNWEKFVDTSVITKAIDVNAVLDRFDSKFGYMHWLRKNVISYK